MIIGNKEYITKVKERVRDIFDRGGIFGHVSADNAFATFCESLIMGHVEEKGDIEEVLFILENVKNLHSPSILLTNFRKDLRDFYPIGLENNELFDYAFKRLLSCNGKGIGVGELAIPLLFKDFQFSNVNDGKFTYLKKVYRTEIKNGVGASLKPIPTGTEGTYKKMIDDLRKDLLEGTTPCFKKGLAAFLEAIERLGPQVLEEFYRRLYVGADVTDLLKEVIDNEAWKDLDQHILAVGNFVLKQYQKIDEWDNIMFLHEKKMKIVNIADVNNVDVVDLKLKYTPKMKRDKDTQAIADGYVNVSI